MGNKKENKHLPFKPKAGQIDYTHARWVPVVNCVVKFKDRFLVVRRSKEMNFYPGYWNGISGFLDDHRSLSEKVKDELREELGISARKIKKIKLGGIFDQEEPKYKKTWIVHPVLVEISTDQIRLDWEAEDYRWVTLTESKKLKLLPGFNRVLEKLSLRVENK